MAMSLDGAREALGSRSMQRLNTLFFPTRPISIVLLVWVLAMPAVASDFRLPDMDGREHSLSDYLGRWVVVNYWATWCPPCLEELPELEVFHSNAGGKAVVLGVNMEEIEMSRLRAFVDEQFLSFPILIATGAPRRDQLIGPIEGLPTSYLVSPDGEIVARQVGQVTAAAIDAFIQDYESSNGGQ